MCVCVDLHVTVLICSFETALTAVMFSREREGVRQTHTKTQSHDQSAHVFIFPCWKMKVLGGI